MRDHEADELCGWLQSSFMHGYTMDAEARTNWKLLLTPLDAEAASAAITKGQRLWTQLPSTAEFFDVYEDELRRRNPDSALAPGECSTCGGDRMVLVGRRPPMHSQWVSEHGVEVTSEPVFEEMAPCPDCNAGADTAFRRHDGSRVEAMDPALVRERMVRTPRTRPQSREENAAAAQALLDGLRLKSP